MTLGEFVAVLERRGADLHRWPVAERLAGEVLLETSAKAALALADARRFEEHLAVHDPIDAIAEDRIQRITAAVMAMRTGQPGPSTRRFSIERAAAFLGMQAEMLTFLTRFATPMLLAALLGILVGQQFSRSQPYIALLEPAALWSAEL
jgi:hypothetical protein